MSNYHPMRNLLVALVVACFYVLPLQARDLPDFTVLAENNAASVVNISTKQKLVSQLSNSPEKQRI